MKRLLIPLLAIFLLASCTKENSTIQQDELHGTSLKGGPADITIEPSGDLNGATDANAIEAALAALPAGGILLLDEGTFYINRTIVAPEGFNGTVRGKGMDNTLIRGVGDVVTKFSVSPPVTTTSLNYYPNECLFLFYNPDGLVNVTKLSMSIPVDFETDGDFRHSLFGFITTIMRDNEADTNFSELKLTGKNIPYPDDEASPAIAILVAGSDANADIGEPPLPIFGGTHTVADCIISKIGVPPSTHAGFKDARIILKGNNCFDARQTQLFYLVGCNITVKDNNMSAFDISALNFSQGPFSIPGESNKVEIKNNIISTTAFMAVEIGPAIGDADFEVVIKNNVLKNTGDRSQFGFPFLAVVGIFQGNENAIVEDNYILGKADYGIFQLSDHGSFKANNFSDFNANTADFFLLGNDNELKEIGTATVQDLGTGNTIKN